MLYIEVALFFVIFLHLHKISSFLQIFVSTQNLLHMPGIKQKTIFALNQACLNFLKKSNCCVSFTELIPIIKHLLPLPLQAPKAPSFGARIHFILNLPYKKHISEFKILRFFSYMCPLINSKVKPYIQKDDLYSSCLVS